MTVRFLAPANRELEQAIEWYAAISPAMGERFITSAKIVVKRIERFPYSSRARTNGIRNAPIPGFPFALRYRIEQGEIFVYAVRHDKQKPGYWIHRLR